MAEYGPTGVVVEHSEVDYRTFLQNFGVIHQHEWLGGEIVHVTNMCGENNYYEKEWWCQFCGVHCKGETLDYASKSVFVPEELQRRLDARTVS